MNKKSVLFTLDVIFAVLVASSLIVYSYLYLSETKGISYNQQHLYKMTMDSLAILEKKGSFQKAVETYDITELQKYVNALPDQVCGYIAFYNSSSVGLFSVIKEDCDLTREFVASRRVFIANDKIYFAHMRSWFKEQ